MEIQKFDRRIIKRNLDSGSVSEKEYKKHLADLKNMEKECEIIHISLYGEDEDPEAGAENAEAGEDAGSDE